MTSQEYLKEILQTRFSDCRELMAVELGLSKSQIYSATNSKSGDGISLKLYKVIVCKLQQQEALKLTKIWMMENIPQEVSFLSDIDNLLDDIAFSHSVNRRVNEVNEALNFAIDEIISLKLVNKAP